VWTADLGAVYKEIDGLPTGGWNVSQQKTVGAIHDTLQQNRCLNTLLMGFLFERTTSGTLEDRFKQLQKLLLKPPTMKTMAFRLNYYTVVKRWPLLLCEDGTRHVSGSKKKILRRAKALDALHTKAGVNSEFLVTKLTS